MAGWNSWSDFFQEGFKQAEEEGRDMAAIAAIKRQYNELSGDGAAQDRALSNEKRVQFANLLDQLFQIPIQADFPFQEPDDLDAIKAQRHGGVRRFNATWNDAELLDKLHGAWLGRTTGCALGKPPECLMNAHGALASWQRQKEYLTAISPHEWPLADYFPPTSPAQEKTGSLFCPLSMRGNIAFMESDDDIRYTILGQIILTDKGRDFTSWDVAWAWMSHLPYRLLCTAETQAYRNLIDRYDFHSFAGDGSEVDWHWVATHQNPYREWIGAQIRIDSYGYAAPGHPELAAEFAWRDARISHVKNGIYGAMFCAAMIAASFATKDVYQIIEAGLSEIPKTSRLHRDVCRTIEICEKYRNDLTLFESVIGEIYEILGHYSAVHTNNNAAICVAALLLSQGDFHQGITLAVMGGLDTDCNGATVGSIVGAINGARNVPSHWTERLNDTVNSEIIGYHPISISECAQRSFQLARKFES